MCVCCVVCVCVVCVCKCTIFSRLLSLISFASLCIADLLFETIRDRLRVGWFNEFSFITSLWEVYHESRRCSRDTYPESYITNYTAVCSP